MIKTNTPLSFLISPVFYLTLLTLVFCPGLVAQDGANGPGVDNTARPAGTLLKFVPLGGRMVTFHRGYLYIMGQGKTTLWDVSDATDPQLLSSEDYGDNGHRWWKLNTDLFWREYSMPEIEDSGYHFMDMSDMLDLKPWTDASAPVPLEEGGHQLLKWQFLETFPTNTNGGNVHDLRYDDPALNPDAITSTFDTNSGAQGSLRFRIGNLMFATTGTGIAALDIGDPENVRVLDAYLDPGFQQYTTTYHVWRDKIVFLNGNNGNLNNNNLAMIDFSDPTDLKPYVWPNGRTGLTTEEMSAGRYMYFQDEFGFAGHTDLAVKLNMETGEIVQEFHAPGWPQTFLDYQWMPLGPVVVATGSNSDDGRSFFYQHQDEPDTRGPEIGFHSPAADSIDNPVSTVIGFSIPEIIDERTANDQTIQIRAVGSGVPIEADITWNSYHVLNFVPKQFLEPNTTYEVTFVEGGLQDVAGNGIEEYTFRFSTGGELVVGAPPVIEDIRITGIDDENPALINTLVNFEAAVSGQDGLAYRWDIGNGNTEWSSDATFSASFNAAGLYNITVQVKDSEGTIGAATRTLVVVETLNAQAPTKSGMMAFAQSPRRLLVVNPDNDSVTAIDPDSLAVIEEWSSCDAPVSVAVDAYDKAWVSCRDDDVVMVYDVPTGEQERSIALSYGAQPRGIVSSPNGEQVYVALSGKGGVLGFDAETQSQTAELALGHYARALAINTDGDSMLVSQFISSDQGVVWEVALPAMTLANTYGLENDTTTPDAGNAAGGLPNYLAGLAIAPNGKRAFVAGKKDNTDRGLFLGDEPLSFEFSARSNISELNLHVKREELADRIDIDNHAQPTSLGFSPFGRHLFVTMQGNNRLIVLNPDNGRELSRVDTGLAPQDVVVDAETKRVFVKNFMSRDVSVFDARQLLSGVSNQLTLLDTLSTVTNETLAAQVLLGKQIFYNAADTRMTAEGYLSCATCHDDAGHDGRVWDFTARGEGLRNTIALNGREGMAHGRVHWSANFDEIQDFEHDIRNAFAGSGFMSDDDFDLRSDSLGMHKAGVSAELDALATYLSSLDQFAASPYRNSDGSLTDEAVIGRQVFEDRQCASCHSGAPFTDSPSGAMHDVGTIGDASGQRLKEGLHGIDTPTLRDLWSSAPYLHDGSIANLAELVAQGGSAHHMSELSDSDQRALVAYLLQIDGAEPAADMHEQVRVSITSFANDDELREEAITLSAESNIEGVQELQYFANGERIATAESAPFAATWQPESGGHYRVYAKAFHANDVTATLSPELSIHVGPSGECSVQYEVIDIWSTGYRVKLLVTNESSRDVEGYSLKWLAGGDEFVNGWSASYSVDELHIIASNSAEVWNGILPADGGSAEFGFQFNKAPSSAPSLPAEIRLNGRTCGVSY